MVENRKTLGLTLNITDNWIGGTYYIMNLIKALNTLDDHLKPHIVILSPEPHAYTFTKEETHYPYFQFIRTIYSVGTLKGIINRLLKKRIFIKKIAEPIDILYPAWDSLPLTDVKKKVYWIPDFQEHYFSEFFSNEELQKRKNQQTSIAAQADYLILSSEDAKKDFLKFYPQHHCKIQVLPFAVSNPGLESIDAAEVLKKYNVLPGYFFIANQFWVHKNHLVLLEAIRKLKEERLNYQFVFTGKTNDYRSAGYFEMLKQKVQEWGIENEVNFLGFIDRIDQLVLMKYADSIIQPSLFEGWSTVIEDAKSLGKHIIASNIAVHKEQLIDYPHLLFESRDSRDLAEKIKAMMQIHENKIVHDYDLAIRRFGEKVVSILLN